jgi:hypothetical protein
MDNFEIRFHELPHSKPIRNSIRSKLAEWLKQHEFCGTRDEMAKVEFFRSDLDHKIGCYIEVKKGNTQWRNFEYGKGIQGTFQLCLKRLQENTQLQNDLSMKGA